MRVEADLLDLEEQPPVNQCHSLSTMTAAQSGYIMDDCGIPSSSASSTQQSKERQAGGLQDGWQQREEAIEIVIMSVKGSGWPAAPPAFNNPIITARSRQRRIPAPPPPLQQPGRNHIHTYGYKKRQGGGGRLKGIGSGSGGRLVQVQDESQFGEMSLTKA